MSVGVHSVLLYPDPNAGGWSPAGIYNPSFDLGVDGWQGSPYTPAITSPAVGTVRQVTTSGAQTAAIMQAEARVLARVDTGLYRMTARLKVSKPSTWFYGVHFGDTAANAIVGPYWAGTDHAASRLASRAFPSAGTYTVDITVNPAEVASGFGFVTPAISMMQQSGVTVDYYSVDLEYLVGESLDVSCLVDEISVVHGRDDSTVQPNASTATVDLDLRYDVLPELADIGSLLAISTTIGTAESTRFFGRITDLTLGFDDVGEHTPEAVQGQLIAVGMLADLGRRVVGDEPWPQELDGARVQRILGLAGLDPSPITSDPGTVQIIARDVDAKAALEVAQDAAESASGIVWQTRDGDVRYADASHRRGVTAALVLDACDVLVTPTWSRTIQGLVNKVTVTYGVTPEGGEQPTTSGESTTSQARYGKYDYSLATSLAALADAQAMVGLLLARNSAPVWLLTSLPVDMKGLSDEDTTTLLGLDMHALVNIVGMPPVTPTSPTSAHLWVEGWRERLAWGEHEVELYVSGYCRTAPAPRWDDVQDEWLWDAMGDLSWDDAACLGPPTRTDRWADVPASERWDTVPPATTWDTYTGA